MTLSVCLTLDARADRSVRALWSRLEAAGVPTLLSHTHGRHVPHLTLASLRSWRLEEVDAALSGLPPATLAPVTLDAFGTFRRSRCWLVPAPTTRLLLHQEAVVEAVRRTGADLHKHYAPGAWIPHVTLAPRLHLKDLATVAALVYDVLPIIATTSGPTLIDTSTGEHLPLTGV